MTNQQYILPARFGAKPRPHDPEERKYAYAKPAKAADWSKRVGIPRDFRAPVWSQANSDCTASICEALESSARFQGRSVPDLSHRLVYFLAREYQGWASRTDPNKCLDEGAFLADAAKAARAGLGKESLFPYTKAHWEPPTPEVEQDSPNQDWLLADRAIYPGDPGASDMVYDALNRGYTLQIGWVIRSDMYSPDGPYPVGLTPDPYGRHGYHASYLCYAFPHNGTIWGVQPNSWDVTFNPNIDRYFPPECVRPGEAVYPLLDWVDRRNSPIFEIRVLDLEPFTQPQPEPEPDPEDEMSYSEGYAQCRADVVAFLRDSETFYKEYQPRTEFISAAEVVVTWHREQVENFLPPMAAPKYQRPVSVTVTTNASPPKTTVYDSSTGRPIG